MSQWDFGYGGQPAEQQDLRVPPYGPSETTALSGEAGWPGDGGYPGDGGEPYGQEPSGQDPYAPDSYDQDLYDQDPHGQEPGPYPITYERDRFEPTATQPAGALLDTWPAAPDTSGGWFGDGLYGEDESWAPEPGPAEPAASQPAGALLDTWPPAPDTSGGSFGDGLYGEDESWAPEPGPAERAAQQSPRAWPGDLFQPWPPAPGGPGRGAGPASGRPRWLIPAAVVVAGAAIGAAAFLLTPGHPHATAASGATAPTASSAPKSSASAGAKPSQAATAASPPLSLAEAKGVLAAYTTANNASNAQRSDAELAAIETGGSDAIDAGLYRMQVAAGGAPYPAFMPVQTTYYIPSAEPATGPRWFIANVANAFASSPEKVASTEYLLFTQATPGGPWENAIEPYQLAAADVPQIMVGGDGLATAVSVTSTSLAAAPGQLAALTAASLDGTGGAGQAGVTVADAGGLADRSDQQVWRGKLPTATVTDTHAPATGADGETFALLTTGGGALVFYTDAASLAVAAPAGSTIHLTVPGFYSSAQALTRAGLSYLDQFAAYDPPAGAGAPRVVAEYSGITGTN